MKQIRGDQKVFFTSDPHAFHKNITRGVTEWKDRKDHTRDFQNEVEMTEAIAYGINKYVGKLDTLVVLGDWSFGGLGNIYHFREMLNVRSIHFIYGNHDHHIEGNKPFPQTIVNQEFEKTGSLKMNFSTQDLFSSVNYVETFSVEGQSIFCSHYAHRVWDKHQHGRWHLYGHSHSGLESEPLGKSLDVGVDNAYRLFGEYRPFSMEDLHKILDEREIHKVDHHNKNTH